MPGARIRRAGHSAVSESFRGLDARPAEDSRQLRHHGITIGYAGALNYGYGDRIAEVMPVLASRRYAPADLFARGAAASSRRRLRGSFRRPADLWNQSSGNAISFGCRSPRQDMRSLYQTHFPSKFTEYLALGMPVAITGPREATGVGWGLRHPDAALTIADETPGQIRDAFVALRADGDSRYRLAAAAHRVGDADFDPVRIRDGFFEALRMAASPSIAR